MSGPLRRAVVVLILLSLAVILLARTGWDTSMREVATTPVTAQTLASPPREVVLTLSVPADAARSHLTVAGSDGQPVGMGPLTAGPGPVLRLPVEIGTDGTYVVAYHVVGDGGGTASGSLSFGVGKGAPVAAPDVSHEHGVDPLSAALLAVNFLAVVTRCAADPPSAAAADLAAGALTAARARHLPACRAARTPRDAVSTTALRA